MKVKMSSYPHYIGPYEIAKVLLKFGASEDRVFAIGEWLSETWVAKVCEFLQPNQQRSVSVKIEKYDTWNMDSNLAYIIVPMLKQLREQTHGSPLVTDDDVPEEFRSTSAPPVKEEYDIDDNHFKRWDWVLSEMIWTFEQILPETNWEEKYYSGEATWPWEDKDSTFKLDRDGFTAHSARIDNGLRLFGKYYRGLWT